MNGTINIK